MITQYFKLEKLSCPACIMHLEAMEDNLSGVLEVEADYKKQVMTVVYDETILTVDLILQAVTDMGYVAIPTTVKHNNRNGDSIWKRLFR